MKPRTHRTTIWIWILLLVAPAAIAAQQTEPGPREPGPRAAELRTAMRQYFENRLRRDLALGDEQIEHILPRIQAFEENKRESQRELAGAVRDLRRGLDQGADDKELRKLLQRVDDIERERWERERKLLREVGEVLTARQEVQLRFFLQQFRRQMQDKIRELRGGGEPRGRPGRRLPRGEMP